MKKILMIAAAMLATSGFAHAEAAAAVTRHDRVAPHTGAVFIPDTSNPSLGEAYRDPSGLIWGSVVMEEGEVKTLRRLEAQNHCESIGATLPSREDFERLREYARIPAEWPYSHRVTYSPYLADDTTELLPGLSKNWFWSNSDVRPSHDPTGQLSFVFSGATGAVGRAARSIPHAFRCVLRSQN